MSLLPPITRTALAAAALLAALTFGAEAARGAGGGGTSAGGNSNVDPDMPGELMVKLLRASSLPALLNQYPVTLVSRFGARPIYRLKVIGTARVKDVLAAMAVDPAVLIAEANATHRSPEARRNGAWVIGSPSDYVAQWAPNAMHLSDAQALATGQGVRVAVLDTGVEVTHPLLVGHMMRGRDFVDGDTFPAEVPGGAGFGHGTHVAGLVALAAPKARIMPLRVLDADGVGNAWVLAEALLYAIDPDGNPATDDGAQVINLSLGSLSRTRIMAAISQLASCEPPVPDDPIGDQSDPGYIDDQVRCAAGRSTVIIAAAGNDGSSNVRQYPAAEGAYGLLAVGASTSAQRVAAFSNTGSWVGVAAPGEGISSALPGGLYGTWSGTSMAAPLVAGTAALIRSRTPSLPAKDVIRQITRNTSVLCGSNLRQVDAAAAVADVRIQDNACR